MIILSGIIYFVIVFLMLMGWKYRKPGIFAWRTGSAVAILGVIQIFLTSDPLLILNEIYPKLLEDYNSLPLSPENQKELTERSITVIRRIRLLLSNMLKDLLDAKLYFIVEPLAIDNFYRDINYFLYILDADNKEV